MATVAELKAGIAAATQEANTCVASLAPVVESLGSLAVRLAHLMDGSGDPNVAAAQASVANSGEEIGNAITGLLSAIESLETYSAPL